MDYDRVRTHYRSTKTPNINELSNIFQVISLELRVRLSHLLFTLELRLSKTYRRPE